jgi:Na+/H+ antiporter subunit
MNGLNVISGVLVVAGATLALTAAVGVVRFSDTLSRIHPDKAAGAGLTAGSGRRGYPASGRLRRRDADLDRIVHRDHRTDDRVSGRPTGIYREQNLRGSLTIDEIAPESRRTERQ